MVTDTNYPGVVSDFHAGFEIGYAYETATHFVHFYGTNNKLFPVHTGLTVIESKTNSAFSALIDWVQHNFGAKNIQTMVSNVGESVEGVWRPELYYYADTYHALKTSEADRRLSEQALRVLLEKLDDVLLYIELDPNSLSTYSHKIRELLILACTEVENFWVHYMNVAGVGPIGRNYTTNDYVKLYDKLFLKEYKCSLRSYVSLPPIKPFGAWDTLSPTASLSWYDAYNKTKHNRASNFSEASLLHALYAVIANVVMYIVRYSPYPMLEESGTFNSLINQHFSFELDNPDISKFYVPLIDIPSHFRKDIFAYDAKKNRNVQSYTVKPLTL